MLSRACLSLSNALALDLDLDIWLGYILGSLKHILPLFHLPACMHVEFASCTHSRVLCNMDSAPYMLTLTFTFRTRQQLGTHSLPPHLPSLKHATGVLRWFEPPFHSPIDSKEHIQCSLTFLELVANECFKPVSMYVPRMYSMHNLRFAVWFQQVLDQVKSTEELVRKRLYGRWAPTADIESKNKEQKKKKKSRKINLYIASASLKGQGVCWALIHTYVGARHPPFEV